MEIFKLFGSVFIKTEEAEKSLAKVEEKGQKAAISTAELTSKVNKFALGLGAMVTAGIGALVGFANKSAETADRIDKLSAKVGLSKQAFQEWDYVMAQNGMDIEKMQVGVKSLTQKMEAATNGNKDAIASFNKLGLSVTDSTGKLKTQEQMTNEAILALAGMENGTEKARLATELFGKAGIEMLPMLNGGADGIEELKNRAHELGLVMSDEAVTSGVVLGDTMDDVKKSLGMVVTQIGVKVMPIIQKLLDWFLKNMPTIKRVTEPVFLAIGNAIEWVSDNSKWLIPVLGGLLSAILALNVINGVNTLMAAWKASTIATTLAQGGLNAVLAANPIALVVLAIGALVASLIYLWNNCEWFRNLLTGMFDVIMLYINEYVIPCWTAFKDIVIGVFQGVWEFIEPVITGIKTALGGLIDFVIGVFSGEWSRAWKGIVGVFEGIWSSIKSVAKVPLNWLIGAINTIIDGVNWMIDKANYLPGVDIGMVDKIPEFAKGTDFFRGGYALVGEQGPELVEMPRGSKVKTNEETESMLNKDIYVVNNTYLDGKLIATETKKAISREQGQMNVGKGRLGFA